MNFDHIKEPMTLEQIKAAYDSHDYSAELLLQHLLKCAVADSDDAARYRWLRRWTRGIRTFGIPEFSLPRIEVMKEQDIMRGSVAQHLDAAIDAARSTT